MIKTLELDWIDLSLKSECYDEGSYFMVIAGTLNT